jgi:hypothetical protein
MQTFQRKIINKEEGEDSLKQSRNEGVEDFLTKIRFFPVSSEIASRILRLNYELGDCRFEAELGRLSSNDVIVNEQMIEINETWLHTMIDRVSSILFHGENTPTQIDLSTKELVSLFQKTVSEKIYDRLSFLSLSPHAKKGEPFSLKEELTEGIAEDIGLGHRIRAKSPDHLSRQAQDALMDLAWEFQCWLVLEHNGVFLARWGEIRALGVETLDRAALSDSIVWLDPDVRERVEEQAQKIEERTWQTGAASTGA